MNNISEIHFYLISPINYILNSLLFKKGLILLLLLLFIFAFQVRKKGINLFHMTCE